MSNNLKISIKKKQNKCVTNYNTVNEDIENLEEETDCNSPYQKNINDNTNNKNDKNFNIILKSNYNNDQFISESNNYTNFDNFKDSNSYKLKNKDISTNCNNNRIIKVIRLNDDNNNNNNSTKYCDKNLSNQLNNNNNAIGLTNSNNILNDINEEPEYKTAASKLKNRKKVNKRCSMTDIDFINRQAAIKEIKESTRVLVDFTIKNLSKTKKIEHFINSSLGYYTTNDSYNNLNKSKKKLMKIQPKDKEFEFYYEIIDNLGEGTSSVVKLCKNKENNLLFAVKIFRAFDDEYINFAKNEFNNLASINSINVAKVYEMFYDQNIYKIFTIMEYCKGITLKKLVNEIGSLPENLIKSLSYNITKGILSMHGSGVVHRDLKHDNIIVDTTKEEIKKIKFFENEVKNKSYMTGNNNGLYDDVTNIKIKIIDLNVSRSKDNKEGTYDGLSKKNMIMSSISGTPQFSAPELLENYSCYTEQIDMWSLGCLLYFMVTGYVPYNGKNVKDILYKIKNDNLNFTGKQWINYSYDLKLFISSLLTINWIERLSAYEALNHKLFYLFNKNNIYIKNNIDIRYSKTKTNALANKNNVEYLNYLMNLATIDIKNNNKSRSKSITISFNKSKKDV